MTEALTTAFGAGAREGFELALLLFLSASWLAGQGRLQLGRHLFIGAAAALALGLPVGATFLEPGSRIQQTWVFWSLASEFAVFYSSVFVINRSRERSGPPSSIFLFILAFILLFFEAGALGSVLNSIGHSSESRPSAFAAGMAGLLAGLSPLPLASRFLLRLDWKGFWSLPSLLLSLGALRLATGGMSEFESQNLLISMQRGLEPLVRDAVRHIQGILLIPDHPYLPAPMSGFMDYMGGDRMAMSLMVLIVFFPPVWLLARLVAAPDPELRHIDVGAERRMKLALFRQDITFRGVPMMLSFLIIVFLVHSANLSLNPLFDPDPIPVVAEEDREVIKIPLADSKGDFTDQKMRRYAYFYGDKKIVFLAIMKPDGSLATTLDECEICRPAPWNTKAIGYAQRGKNMVCKYCVTPITVETMGEPGGCNPIPFESESDDNYIYIPLKNLIDSWKWAQKLEKAGTHF